MDNMTALVSAFARAYHYRNSDTRVFSDSLAERILSDGEYAEISRNMAQGIAFFAPGFRGSPEEALRHIVHRQLAPSVLARSAFCERAAADAARVGCRQFVLYACGYDTFALRQSDAGLSIYALDRPEMIADVRRRVERGRLLPACRVEWIGCDLSLPGWEDALVRSGFDPEKTSFGSLLGISYYLCAEEFRRFIASIASIACEGSSICFDYPLREDGSESLRNRALASAAGEPMKARYSRGEMESLLSEAGFLIRSHMDAAGATDAFFREYNRADPAHPMAAPEGVAYCLAVREQAAPVLR